MFVIWNLTAPPPQGNNKRSTVVFLAATVRTTTTVLNFFNQIVLHSVSRCLFERCGTGAPVFLSSQFNYNSNEDMVNIKISNLAPLYVKSIQFYVKTDWPYLS